MRVFLDLQQGSEAWETARLGKPTASRFSDILTAKTCKLSASADKYIDELIAESWGLEEQVIPSKWMDRGTELEPLAREAFQIATGLRIVQVGFITRDDRIVGCSPDAMVLRDDVDLERDASVDCRGVITNGHELFSAGVEIKCPKRSTHVGYFRRGVLPDEYTQQVHGGMAVTDLDQWYFWSWTPGPIAPFLLDVRRSEYTDKLSEALDDFIIKYHEARKVVPLLSAVAMTDAESTALMGCAETKVA